MFLVTRPQPKADETVNALKAHGFAASALPVMRIESLPLREPNTLKVHDILVVTSIHTESFLNAHLSRLIEHNSTVVCVGNATADMLGRVLKANHMSATIEIASPQSSEGVLASAAFSALQQDLAKASASIGLVKGKGGRDLIANFLKQKQIKNTVYEVYQRKNAIEPSNLKQLDVTLIKCIVVTSIEVAEYICQCFPIDWQQGLTFMVASERVEAFLKANGAQQTIVSDGASTHAIVACAKKLYKSGVLDDRR